MMLLRGEQCEDTVRRIIGTGEGSARERFRWGTSCLANGHILTSGKIPSLVFSLSVVPVRLFLSPR